MEQQHMKALKYANTVRLARAACRRSVIAGETNPVDLIRQPPDFMERVPVWEMVEWVPSIGKVQARKMLRRLVPAETLFLRDLGPVTRSQVAWAMNAYLERHPAKAPTYRAARLSSVEVGREALAVA